jgi:hypothetical protein
MRGAGDGNRTRMASLEGCTHYTVGASIGGQARPGILLTVVDRGYCAICRVFTQVDVR